jgi:large subunit ribosomal protein L28
MRGSPSGASSGSTMFLCPIMGFGFVRGPDAGGKSSEVLEQAMAQVCNLCGKGPQFGNNISHAHNVTRRKWNVNLRPVKAKLENGSNKRIRVCTSCIKSGKVVKA